MISFTRMMATAVLITVPLGTAIADSAPAKSQTQSLASQPPPRLPAAQKPLDLKAPALDRVFSRAQIETLTSKPDDVSESAETTVDVAGARHDLIIAPSGFAGLAWAARHPTQAWRLFVPSPSN